MHHWHLHAKTTKYDVIVLNKFFLFYILFSGNNIHIFDLEQMDPQAKSSSQEHGLASDIFEKDINKDSDNSSDKSYSNSKIYCFVNNWHLIN